MTRVYNKKKNHEIWIPCFLDDDQNEQRPNDSKTLFENIHIMRVSFTSIISKTQLL